MIKAKAIKPHTPFNPGVFRQEMHASALSIMANMTRDFNKTVRTWKHEVDFKSEVNDKPSEISVSVSTDDKIYGYVDKGTKPHIIRAKRSPRLFFKKGYKAKTTPHVIGSHQGGALGKTVVAKQVKHPGNDPRYFTRDIQAKYQPKLKKEMESAIARAAKKSGHSAAK